MRKVLITGATGNVGREVIRALAGEELQVLAGVRNPESRADVTSLPGGVPIAFDFADSGTFNPALAGVEHLFLLRPPQLADVRRYFGPVVLAAQKAGVQHVTFLSVQGADTNSFIPHHKIEQLIKGSGMAYTFLRPAYFMQNFTTTLLPDIRNRQRIFLPAGKALFSLVDLCDVAAVAAQVITHPEGHRCKAYDLTSTDLLDFGAMARIISDACGRQINYVAPNLLSFYLAKRKEGLPAVLIGVMIMLHYFPRFQEVPSLSPWVASITGRPPISFRQFAQDHAHLFLPVTLPA